MPLMKKKLTLVNFITIVFALFSVAERFFRLFDLPRGIHVDEAGMAYDAYCLATYGVDRYLNSLPVYLRNFGGGQSALYAYLCAGLIKLFGISALVIKLPGIIFSLMTYLFGALIVKKILKTDTAVMVYTILFSIAPYFLMASRLSLDCNLMLGLSTAFLYCFMEAIDRQSTWRYVVAGVLAGLTLYTYALSYLVLPFFLLSSFVYLICLRKITWKNAALFSIPLALLATPLIIEQYVNLFDKETLHILGLSFPKLMYRVGEFSWPSLKCLFATFKVAFFNDTITYNSYPKYMVLYPVSVPFALIGIVAVFREWILSLQKKLFSKTFFILVWFLGELLVGSMLSGEEVNVNKLNGIYFVMAYFAVAGFMALFQWMPKKPIRLSYCVATAILYAICMFGFYRFYFVKVFAVNEYEWQLNPDFTAAFSYMQDELNQDGTKTIYMGSEAQNYIYYCIATLPNPADLDLETGYTKDKTVSFYLSSELDPNGIYLVYKQPDYLLWLENSDYVIENYEGYSIAYRN